MAIATCLELIERGASLDQITLGMALMPFASNDTSIYEKQVYLVTKTYTKEKGVPEDVKEITFQFIEYSLRYSKYIHVNLLEYIFLHNNISQEAYELLYRIKDNIKKAGMEAIPYSLAKSVLENQKNSLEYSEAQRLKSILDIYNPYDNPSIH